MARFRSHLRGYSLCALALMAFGCGVPAQDPAPKQQATNDKEASIKLLGWIQSKDKEINALSQKVVDETRDDSLNARPADSTKLDQRLSKVDTKLRDTLNEIDQMQAPAMVENVKFEYASLLQTSILNMEKVRKLLKSPNQADPSEIKPKLDLSKCNAEIATACKKVGISKFEVKVGQLQG